MESSTSNSNMTFVDDEFKTLAPHNLKRWLLITVLGFIATVTIYVTVKIFLKNRHRLETIHLFIINELIGNVDKKTNYFFFWVNL